MRLINYIWWYSVVFAGVYTVPSIHLQY